MSPSMPACQGTNAIESAAPEAAHVRPDAALAARREQHPAAHGEAVEERQQHRGRAHVAPDQRQAEDGTDHEHRDHRRDGRQRQQRLAPPVPPGEGEPDREAHDDRLAQRVAEVLQRPVGRLLGPPPAVDRLGQVRRPVQRVQRVARDVPVQRGPEARRERRERRVREPSAVVQRGPHPEHVEPAEHPRLGPHQPRHDEQRQHRRAAPARARLQQHRGEDQQRERGVLVAEQRVALEHRARQHDHRGDRADPGREELRAEPVGEPHDAAEAQQHQPHQQRVGAGLERRGEHRDHGLERMRGRREVGGVVGFQPAREVARPHQRVARVVVQEAVVDQVEQRSDADDRRRGGQESQRGAPRAAGGRGRRGRRGGGGGHRARDDSARQRRRRPRAPPRR